MKLKDLINENLWNERKFGEPLPTLEDTTKAHQLKELGPDDFKGGKTQKMKFNKDYAGVGKDKLSDKEKEKARKLGLVWKGKGYGKEKEDGITHKNVDGKLVKVDKGGDSDKKSDKPEPKKLSGKDFDRDLPSDEKEKSPTSTFDAPIEPDQINPKEVKKAIDHIRETEPKLADEIEGHLEDLEYYGQWDDEEEEFGDYAFEDEEYGEDAERAGYAILNKIRDFNKKNSDGPNPTSKDSPLVKKDEPKKQYGNTTNQPTDEDSVRAAKDVLDQIKNIEFDDSFEDGPQDYETVLDALGSITNTELENWEELENKINDFQSDQDADSGRLLKMTLQSVVDKKDVYSNKYLGAGDDNIPEDDPYTDGEIETIVDKDVDEIKAMLYGKNPLAKYMSYKDDKYIQQHIDALKDGNLSPYEEDFHKDELFAVMSQAQQNMQMGKVKQGERFSGNRTNLPKSKNENYNPSDKYLKESIDLLKRDFGAPLPTLQSVMEKHQKNIKEGPDDVKVTKKQLQMLIKQEGDFRKRMLNIEQGFLRDPRPENKKLAKEIKKSYKDNVTKFMREVVGMLKRMK